MINVRDESNTRNCVSADTVPEMLTGELLTLLMRADCRLRAEGGMRMCLATVRRRAIVSELLLNDISSLVMVHREFCADTHSS
jgi:hypothetical protein